MTIDSVIEMHIALIVLALFTGNEKYGFKRLYRKFYKPKIISALYIIMIASSSASLIDNNNIKISDWADGNDVSAIHGAVFVSFVVCVIFVNAFFAKKSETIDRCAQAAFGAYIVLGPLIIFLLSQ
jgi:hypothetical protein